MQNGSLGPQMLLRRFMEAEAVYIIPSVRPAGARFPEQLSQLFGSQLQYLLQLLMRCESFLLAGSAGESKFFPGAEDLVVHIDLVADGEGNSVLWICSVHDVALGRTVSTAPREFVPPEGADERQEIREDVFKGILEMFDQYHCFTSGVL